MKYKILFQAAIFLIALNVFSQTGKPNPKLAKGYVYVKQIDDVWWFIGPYGEKFISQGVNHFEIYLYLAPYNKEETMNKFGDELIDGKGLFDINTETAQKLIDGQIEICRDLHFNKFAKQTHASIAHELFMDKIYYITSFKMTPVVRAQKRIY